MSVAQSLLAEVTAAGCRAWADGGLIRLRGPRPLPGEIMGQLREHKAELLAILAEPVTDPPPPPADLLTDACAGLPLTVTDLLAELDADEREDARAGRIEGAILRAFAVALVDRRDRGQGVVPATYIHRATCEHCGPIWCWRGGHMASCAWCANRLQGLPIPRPATACCAACRHFERTRHEHEGHCAAGQPEPPAGLWDTDKHFCRRRLPVTRPILNKRTKP